MAKGARFWIGARLPDGRPAEFFGGAHPLPARDLSADEVEGLTPDQAALLESPAGKRLYSTSKPGGGARPAADAEEKES